MKTEEHLFRTVYLPAFVKAANAAGLPIKSAEDVKYAAQIAAILKLLALQSLGKE